jgi:hypothetical protein
MAGSMKMALTFCWQLCIPCGDHLLLMTWSVGLIGFKFLSCCGDVHSVHGDGCAMNDEACHSTTKQLLCRVCCDCLISACLTDYEVALQGAHTLCCIEVPVCCR